MSVSGVGDRRQHSGPGPGRAWVTGGSAALAAISLAWIVPDFRLYQLALTGTLAIAMAGLTLLMGCSGQLSLGHGAFVGIGGYAVAILVRDLALPYGLAIVAAAGVAGLVGLALAIPAVGLPVNGLALVTLAAALALPQLVKKFDGLTGGTYGIYLASDEQLHSPWSALSDDQFLYLVVTVVATGLCWLAWNVRRGRWGLAMVALRDQPLAAAAMGVDVPRVKVTVFTMSAAFAGAAGGLHVSIVGHAAPDQLALTVSLLLATGVVIGGLGSVAGAVLGAVFVTLVPHYAPNLTPAAPGVAIGAITVLVAVVAPGGLVSIVPGVVRRLAAMRQSRPPARAAPLRSTTSPR